MSTMIQMFGFAKKRSDISLEQFLHHWREVHGPLGLRTIPLWKKYVQNYRFFTQQIPDFLQTPYEGVAEMWFGCLEDAVKFPTSREYLDGLYRDEPNLTARDAGFALNTRGHEVIAGPPIGKDAFLVKALLTLKRKPGMRVAEFQDYWLNSNSSLASSVPDLVRYVQCHVVPEAYDGSDPRFDGVAELWWKDLATFERSWASSEMQNGLLRDLRTILDEDSLTGMLVYEGRLLWT